ncbi:MAG: methionyl-tRNA formyltransferase [Phycisphaerales bacterium]|nr:methionyl-tRNA formyltransferase [Phycisphaerales bacterium]
MAAKQRLVFFGSGEFGLPSLRALVEVHEVALIVSQPDRPSGRGKSLTPTPIAEFALASNIPLLRPVDANTPEALTQIRAICAHAWVVIAFGQKLSPALLADRFAINLHGSLLPAYRGAAPIQRAVMEGNASTGVSVIALAERMDAGVIYASRERTIGTRETSDDVHDALAELGTSAVLGVLAEFERAGFDGRQLGSAQDESQATRARKLSKIEATVDCTTLTAGEARARINGLNAWPGCEVGLVESGSTVVSEWIKLCRVEECEGESTLAPSAMSANGRIGCTAQTSVQCLEVQRAGSRRMSFEEFSRGRPIAVGTRVVPRLI